MRWAARKDECTRRKRRRFHRKELGDVLRRSGGRPGACRGGEVRSSARAEKSGGRAEICGVWKKRNGKVREIGSEARHSTVPRLPLHPSTRPPIRALPYGYYRRPPEWPTLDCNN